jgi:hypothetical protein
MGNRPIRIALTLTAAALLVLPSLAGAQTTTEPPVTQTEPELGPPGSLQSGSRGSGNTRDSGNGGESGNRSATAAQPSASSGGGLPFTGYPWTPVVIVACFLLCIGLRLRIALHDVDRPRLRS